MKNIWRACPFLFLLLAVSQVGRPANVLEQTDLLFSAVLHNDIKMVQDLLKRGADVNFRNVNDMTPLALAVRLRRNEIAALLLDAGADPNVPSKIIFTIGEEGLTPLLWAVENGDGETLQLMFEKGGDVNKASLVGDSPLICASRNGYAGIVELLLDKGAKVDYQNPFTKNTALMEAVLAGHSYIIEYLVNHGANIIQRDRNGNTLLMLAAGSGNLFDVMYLAEKGLKIAAQNEAGDTALHRAIGKLKKTLYTQEYLVKKGINVNAKNRAGKTPLMEAAYRGYPMSVGHLIKMGADLNSVDGEGNTALHYVARGFDKRETIALDLLRRGAQVNVKNMEGNTPLIIASGRRDLSVISALLDNGADVNAQNKNGWSSLMEAAKEGHLPIVKLLTEHGANPSQVNKDGKTAAELANNHKRIQVYEYLKKLAGRD